MLSASFAVLYPISFGPVCWLDSLRNRKAKSLAMSKPLNVFYAPIANAVQQLDNGMSDMILSYGRLFAADGRQLDVAVLAESPGDRFGTPWFVWFDRGLRVGPWLNSTPRPDQEAPTVNPSAASQDDLSTQR